MLIEDPDYASYPAVAKALDALEKADSLESKNAARDMLRKAELQRDIDRGFTDLWDQWERQHAIELGLIAE
ncbi:hypothetical protein [Parasphingorhabdus sp.]|uniref:hypothetical protein n=1 Tax=Parasphingorhabdus sp. TaxID=2709688 RepID=UPI003A959D27